MITQQELTEAPIPPRAPARPGRGLQMLAAALAGGVLVATGYGIGSSRTNDATAPAAVVNESPADIDGEPVAQVARTLLPSVVSIETGTGLGSGFVYDSSGGLILTAAHVVDDADEVTVRIADGTRLKGTVLGRDAERDVAVVRVERSDIPAAKLARGVKVAVGQLAVAVGTPFGLSDSVTAGVVSATARIRPGSDGIEEIQTDAAVNPGNSGGALVDREARVIGINVARSQSDGVAFAVPIDTAYFAAQRIVQGQPPAPVAFIGISGTDPSSGPGGALITRVEEGSVADEAGLRTGDLVRSVDGESVSGMADFAGAIRAHVPGEQVTLSVVRDGETRSIQVTLGRRS